MPFRNLATLQGWVDEFEQLGYRFDGRLKVVQQDGANGANTGLVLVTLSAPPTSLTIQPETRDAIRWAVTIEVRDAPVTLDPPEMQLFATNLSTISALCAFLQAKSLAHHRVDQA